MYAYTLLHGPANTKEIKCVTSSKNQNTGYCKPWYSGFFPLDRFTVNRDFWFLSVLYTFYA